MSDKNRGSRMRVAVRRRASKYLVSVILMFCIIISPDLANANQTAQGTVQLSLTATAEPDSITSATCELYLFTTDPTTNINFVEDVVIQATVTNNVVSCTVTAPYSWSLTVLTGPIYIIYTVSGMNGSIVTKTTAGGFDPIPAATTGAIALAITTIF
jgi:hypothetical protein